MPSTRSITLSSRKEKDSDSKSSPGLIRKTNNEIGGPTLGTKGCMTFI